MALPTNINYCTVTGRFIRAVGDGSDEGREPDAAPLTGLTIKFQAAVTVVKNETTIPPVTILIDAITCTTDTDGYLLGPDGTQSVMLVASDDPDLSPHGWTYKVTVSSPTISPFTFDFIAPSDATVDLATLVPVASNPGSEISAWQAVVTTTTMARDETLAARTEVLEAIAGFDPGEGGGGGSTAWADITGKPTTFAPTIGSGATQAVAGNDSRLTDQRVPTANSVDNTKVADAALSIAKTSGLQTALDGKATTASVSAKADDSAVVKLTGVQTVAGVKTFSSAPVVPDASFAIAKTSGLQSAIDAKADAAATTSALAGKAPTASPTFTGTVSGVTKAHVGLGNADNTADSAKVIAQSQVTNLSTDLATKAPLASPAFTGTPTGITKAHVGLGSVDNTADSAKPVSTAQQAALDAKAPLASPALTGTPTVPTATAGTNTTQAASTAFVGAAVTAAAYAPIVLELAGDSSAIPTGVVFFRKTS